MKQWIIAPAVAGLAAIAWFVKPPQQPPGPGPVSAGDGFLADRLPTAAAPAQAEAAREPVVYVAGAVTRSGVYHLRVGARVDDAVRSAGGLAPGADARAVNLAAPVADGEEIDVRTVAEAGTCAVEPVSGRSAGAHGRRRRRRKAPLADPGDPATPQTGAVDLNAATVADLAALPGVGEPLAARIVAFRSVNGRFEALDDLLDVSGVTQRRIDALAAYVAVR